MLPFWELKVYREACCLQLCRAYSGSCLLCVPHPPTHTALCQHTHPPSLPRHHVSPLFMRQLAWSSFIIPGATSDYASLPAFKNDSPLRTGTLVFISASRELVSCAQFYRQRSAQGALMHCFHDIASSCSAHGGVISPDPPLTQLCSFSSLLMSVIPRQSLRWFCSQSGHAQSGKTFELSQAIHFLLRSFWARGLGQDAEHSSGFY